MSTACIGVVGAYGAVGRAVVARLRAQSHPCRLRLAGRRPEPLRALAGDSEVCIVDVSDSAALARFCSGCRVVINCAGPSHRVFDQVARVAFAQGADYVDPSGDERLLVSLAELAARAPARVAVAAAGMLPGLSGILPRWLAQGFERCERLTTYIGVLDRFTSGGVQDYLAGLSANESLATWEDGRRTSAGAKRLVDVDLPFFQNRVSAHPYLNGEGERLARELHLSNARFYNVFDGEHVLGALARVAGKPLSASELDLAACDVQRAADLDLAGRTPYLLYLFQLDGVREGRACTRSLMMRATGAAELTGAVAAVSTQILLEEEVPAGAHFAADVLAPRLAVQRLREAPVVLTWEVLDGSLQAAATVEEGVL